MILKAVVICVGVFLLTAAVSMYFRGPRPPLEPFPSHIGSMLGPVHIELVPDLMQDDTVKVYGTWDWATRTIQIEQHLPRAAQWSVLRHEQCHVAFDASGQSYAVSEAVQDGICDAVATNLTQEH